MNTNLGLTKDYENEQPGTPGRNKTNFTRRLCGGFVRLHPQVYYSTSRTGRAARNTPDAQEVRSKIPLYCYPCYNPAAFRTETTCSPYMPHFTVQSFTLFNQSCKLMQSPYPHFL
jgi:hypothetical protein